MALVAACGSDSKKSPDAAVPDGTPPPEIDAAADAMPAPPMITISGTAVERMAGSMRPVEGALIAGYRNGDDATPVATAMSAADGTYTLTVATGGVALDGYLKATKAGLKDTYLYPPAPLAANATAPVNMIAPGTLDLLVVVAIGLGGQKAGNGLIAMVVVSGATADSTPVAGAKVTINPATADTKYRYNNPDNDLPDPAMMATAPDGTAFVFNVPANQNVVVSATKEGSTFTSHGVRAVADQFTTTLITP